MPNDYRNWIPFTPNVGDLVRVREGMESCNYGRLQPGLILRFVGVSSLDFSCWNLIDENISDRNKHKGWFNWKFEPYKELTAEEREKRKQEVIIKKINESYERQRINKVMPWLSHLK